MKKNKSNILLSSILIACILMLTTCCRMNNKDISKFWWKYGTGYHIGDVLRFDDNNLKGDTIFKNDIPVAIITFCRKGTFRKTAILEISEIETKKKGTYHQKGPK